MKLLALAFALFASSSFASTDPFDPASCNGSLMSGTRALELLGNKYSVNLAAIGKGGDPSIQAVARERQKINGAIGVWYPYLQNLYPSKIYLKNVDGALGVELYYGRFHGDNLDWSEAMTCKFNSPANNFTCETEKAPYRVLGSGKFTATITDTCARFVSAAYSKAVDREWVFLLNF